MAFLTLDKPQSRLSAFVERKLEQFKVARAQRKMFRTTYSELNALSTRELSDLGIPRSSIRSIAYEAAYKA